MSYDSYKAYLTTTSAPSQTYKDDLQAVVNEQFDNSSSYYTIQEETTFGSGIYQNVNVRITHIIQSSTGVKLPDDYKEIIFQDFSHKKQLGYRYSFDSNIWICISTDYYKYVTPSAVIKRCNNVLKWIKDGIVYSEPCAIDYNFTYDTADWNRVISLPDGIIKVICQSNNNTKMLGVNDRFLFGSKYHSYKVLRIDNLRNLSTSGNDVPIIEFMCEVMPLEVNDNTTLGIANYTGIINTSNIVLSPTTDRICENDEVSYEIYKYILNVKQNNTFTYIYSGVPTALYTFTIVDGNHFKIKNNGRYDNGKLHVVCTANDTDSTTFNFDVSLVGLF